MTPSPPSSPPLPSSRRRRARRALLLALLAGCLAAGAPAAPAAAGAKPTAAVALGDSFISGEAAGSYEPDSNRPGNYCHRSTRAEIHMTSIPGIERTINLACSGATTANVRLGGTARYGEPPQAEQLRAVARDYDVKLVVLTIGANDIGFADIVLDCIAAFAPLVPDCQVEWTPKILERAAATVPRIEQDLRDVRAVMREAGYGDGDYQLILQGYASPVPSRIRPLSWWDQIWAGCPADPSAMAWAHDWVTPEFARMVRTAAAGVPGVRFLDMNGAFNGHEVCAAGATAATEWVRGTFIDPAQLPYGIGFNVVQQSMHPHHAGHAQMGRCLTEFAALGAREGACAVSADGNLHARPGAAPTTP